MKILIIGDVCIDQNNIEGLEYESFGGPAIFMNLILSKFNKSEITITSNYGTDFIKFANGLNLLPKSPNVNKTLIYKNINKNGKRTQFALNRRTADFNIDIVKLKKVAENSDLIIFAPLLPSTSIYWLEILLKDSNAVKICLPQGYFRNFDESNKVIFREFTEDKDLLRLFDYAILSDQDYPNIINLAEKWSKLLNLKVIITKEEKGATYFDNGKSVTVPTKPLKISEIKDSTGAGDVFSAVFAYYITKENDYKNAVVMANKIAGKSLKYTTNELKQKEII